ncbi:nucleoid-associated protein [Endozoicomonadaceae bacterium StTr2]
MAIQSIILHELNIDANAGTLKLRLRDTPLSVTPSLESMLSDLTERYNSRTPKAHGRFNPESESGFAASLNLMLQGEQTLLALSTALASGLCEGFNKAGALQSGYLLFADFKAGLTHYLLIAMLPGTTSITVNDQLEITDSEYMDLSKILLATRINLTEWQGNVQGSRYISWIKPGRGQRLADVFCELLGSEETGDTRNDSQKLVKALDAFCEEGETGDAPSAIKQKAYDYCLEKSDAGAPVDIESLSAHLSEEEPDNFSRFVNLRDYDMPTTMQPEKRQLQKMVRVSGRGKGISLSFDAALLDDDTLSYDPDSGQLVINELPPSLRKQLDEIV